MLTGFRGDGGDRRLGRQLLVGGEAGAIISELGQDLGGIDTSAALERP
jgi:hypothetical protein